MTDFALRTAFSIPRYLATQCVKIRFRYIPQIEINHSLTVFPSAQKCFFSWWPKHNKTNKKQKRKKKLQLGVQLELGLDVQLEVSGFPI